MTYRCATVKYPFLTVYCVINISPSFTFSTLQADIMATPNTPANEEIKKAKEPQNMQQCEKCQKGHKATGFCRDCGKLVCDKCIEVHQTWEDYSSHGIIIFPREIPSSGKLLHCPKHPDNALTLFCEPCQELICNKCTAEQHQGQERHSIHSHTN